MDNVTDDLNSLASIGIDDGSGLHFSLDNVTNVEGGGYRRACGNHSKGGLS